MLRVSLGFVLALSAVGCASHKKDQAAASAASQADAASSQLTLSISSLSLLDTIEPGACVPLVAQSDASDAMTPSLKGKMVTASTSTTTGHFYTDDQCQKPGNQVALTTGDSPLSKLGSSLTEAQYQDLYYQDTAAGAAILTVKDPALNGMLPGSATFNFASPKLQFAAAGDTNWSASSCTELMVAARAADGSGVEVAQAGTFTLTSSATTGHFYSDAACTVAVGSIAIDVLEIQTNSVYYRAGVTGTIELAATPVAPLTWPKTTLSVAVK